MGHKSLRGHGEWISDLPLEGSTQSVVFLTYDEAQAFEEGAGDGYFGSLASSVADLGACPRTEFREGGTTYDIGVCFRVAFGDPTMAEVVPDSR